MYNFIDLLGSHTYVGAEMAAIGLSEYCNELELAEINSKSEHPTDVLNWIRENKYYVLIHTVTREIIGVRTTFESDFSPWKVVFDSEYIPIKCGMSPIPSYASVEEIVSAAGKVLDTFHSEVERMGQMPLKPLFLLHPLGYNDYKAWSITEGRHVVVHEYKSYLPFFWVGKNEEDYSPISSEGKYDIVPPSDDLAECMGLRIYSDIYAQRCKWDKWAQRAPITGCREIIPTFYRSRYDVCIETLNRSFIKDLDYGPEFAKLEERVKQLERLCKEPITPKHFITEQIALIERILPLLENLR